MRTLFTTLILICLIFLSCENRSQKDKRLISNAKTLKINDYKNTVLEKMQIQPDSIIYGDSLYIQQKLTTNLTTYFYKREAIFASSHIYLYFQRDRLVAIVY